MDSTHATLEMGDVASPSLGAADVRLAVRAASVNRADLLARAGRYVVAGSSGGPAIAGMDAAGEVLEVGADVRGIAPGNRVMAMVSGGLAEEVVLPAAMAIPIPPTWSYAEGAAAVVGLLTEHNALAAAGRLARGETVLVTSPGASWTPPTASGSTSSPRTSGPRRSAAGSSGWAGSAGPRASSTWRSSRASASS